MHISGPEEEGCSEIANLADASMEQPGTSALGNINDSTEATERDVWARFQDTDTATNDPLREHSEHLNVGRASVAHDQPHWQDDYATNWDRVGMNRHASTSDAAATAVQQLSGHAALDNDHESAGKSGRSKVWACKLCTYADNPYHSIRCEICDTTRGSTLQDVQYGKHPSNLGREGVGTKLGQHIPQGGSTISHALHSRPASCEAQAEGAGNPAQPQPHVTSKAGRSRGSSKRSQQTISGFLGVASAAKRPNPSVQSVVTSSYHSNPLFTDAKWQCHRCKQWFQLGEQAEHNDYHVALDLHRQSDGSDQRSLANLGSCKSTAGYTCRQVLHHTHEEQHAVAPRCAQSLVACLMTVLTGSATKLLRQCRTT